MNGSQRTRDERLITDRFSSAGVSAIAAVSTEAAAVAMAMTGDPSDTTEARVTGNDDVELAYGSAFYLQEEYLQRLRRRDRHQHHGGKSAERDGDDDDDDDNHNNNNDRAGDGRSAHFRDKGRWTQQQEAELVVDRELQPLFFRLGVDFPALPPPTADEEEAGDGLPAIIAAHEANSDIIMPVVSTTCRLAQSATKGSAALVFLKRQQEIERTTREAMDTSKSDLTRLLRKGEDGQELVDAVSHKEGGTDSWWHSAGDRMEEGDEAEMLRRKVRREQTRLQTPMCSAASASAAVAKVEEKDDRLRHHTEVLRKRQEKLNRLHDAKQRLEEAVGHTNEYGVSRIALLTMQQQLPIFRCKEELLRCIGENPVTIVVGETGSGKTTQLVQYLYHRGYTRGGGIIGCTQPRRLAAIGVARRVAEEMGCALGTRVGYAIHLDDCTTEETEVKFMTDGVLLREVVRDADVSKYNVIVVDEAHERSVNTDVLLGVLQAAVRHRSDLKLVVMSATMDVVKFSKFFGNAPLYEIQGQTFDVEVRYAAAPVDDYVAEAVFRVCQLHVQMPLEGKHDILVFMTGRDDVLGVCELIRRRLQEIDSKWLDTLLVLPCLSEASNVTSSIGVLDAAPPGMRKCVVATNVAETSLTIDGIRYVIDCGFMKTNVFRPKLGMNTLQRYPVSQAQANQRKGRAGRTTTGVCFRLYTEAQFVDEMLPSSVPEIQRSSIDSVVLLLKSIGVLSLVDFDFMDPPPVANIRRSMWQLWVFGLLDDSGAITVDGRHALEFPLAPSLAKVLIESTARGCAVEAVRVVAMISADPKGLFELPKDSEETARQHHSRFYANESDHLTLLNVMSRFLDNGKSRQWARDHFLHVPTLLRACEVQQQLLERLRQMKLPILSCGQKSLDHVRRCVASGFCLQSGRRSSTNWSEYRPMLNMGVTCHIHPSSAVCARAEMPLYVVYHDLLLTTREYLVVVTAVERDWLIEASRGVFCAKGTTQRRAIVAPLAGMATPKPITTRAGATSLLAPAFTSFGETRTVASAGFPESASGGTSLAHGKQPVMIPRPKATMLPSKRRRNI